MASFSISFWPFLSSLSSGFLKELFFLNLTLRKKKKYSTLGGNNKAYYSRLIVMKTWNISTIFGQERQQPAAVPTKVRNMRRPTSTDTSPAIALAAADAVLSFQRRRNSVLQWWVRQGVLSLWDELDVDALHIWRDIVTWPKWRWLLPDTETHSCFYVQAIGVFFDMSWQHQSLNGLTFFTFQLKQNTNGAVWSKWFLGPHSLPRTPSQCSC